jgi:Virulence factor BrkB
MFSAAWKMLRDTVLAFISDEALSRGAAIAFYTVTSIAPVLLIVIAIAGLAFGQDAAQNALTAQLSGLMGQQTAEVLQAAVASAASKSSGVVATIVGIITLMVTASGVFGEMQMALNVIWKAKPKGTTVSRCQSRISRSIGTTSRGSTVSRCCVRLMSAPPLPTCSSTRCSTSWPSSRARRSTKVTQLKSSGGLEPGSKPFCLFKYPQLPYNTAAPETAHRRVVSEEGKQMRGRHYAR